MGSGRVRFVFRRVFMYISQDMNIYPRLLLSVILLIIIPILILSGIFYNRLHKNIQKEMMASYSSIVDQYMVNVRFKLTSYEQTLESITMNRVILDVFRQQDQYDESDLYTVSRTVSSQMEAYSAHNTRSAVHGIILYAMAADFPTDGKNISNVTHLSEEAWFLNREFLRETFLFSGFTATNTRIISLTRPLISKELPNLLKPLGFVKMDVLSDFVFQSVYGSHDKKIPIFFLDDKKQVIHESEAGALELDRLIRTPSDWNEPFLSIVDKEGLRSIVIRRSLPQYGIQGIFVFPYSEIEDRLKETSFFFLLYVLLLILGFSGLTVLFSRVFAHRMSLLIAKFRKAAEGDLSIGNCIEGEDEIGRLDRHFNRMKEQLGNLIQENYIRVLEKREAELNALQFQINPHFLFNTLQSIDTLASRYGANEISEICTRLGEMFRYNMHYSGSDAVPLRDELAHVRNYLFIQNIRFYDRFTTFFDIQEESEGCPVLRFILQPIVENSIVHGFQEKRGMGCLEIRSRIQEDTLLVIVEDDGIGMTKERVSDIEECLLSSDGSRLHSTGSSIGIGNVHARLKLAYGDKYGLFIESRLDAGTKVTLRIPAGKGTHV